jgi:hypothetical protein
MPSLQIPLMDPVELQLLLSGDRIEGTFETLALNPEVMIDLEVPAVLFGEAVLYGPKVGSHPTGDIQLLPELSFQGRYQTFPRMDVPAGKKGDGRALAPGQQDVFPVEQHTTGQRLDLFHESA